MICLELHPGTVAYNVQTFEKLAALSPAIAANIDPSHFFWMHMDANLVVQRLGDRIGYSHGKDVVFRAEKLALNGCSITAGRCRRRRCRGTSPWSAGDTICPGGER